MATIVIDKSVMVPMRDGARLATDVYRLDGAPPAPVLLEPDAVYELRLDLWATANVFLPGHRIRLEVASSNVPRFGRNSHTGGAIASEAAGAYRPAVNRIFHDAAHPSRLILPIIGR